MSSSTLLRLAGLAAVLGGALYTIASIGDTVLLFVVPGTGEFGDAALIPFYVQSGLALLGGALLALGLIGLYVSQSEAVGTFGLASFVAAFLGTALMQGIVWATLLAYLGWALFGVSTLQAWVYPRIPAMLLIIGAVSSGVVSVPTVFGVGGSILVYVGSGAGIILNVAIAWLGYVLFTRRLEETRRPAQASSSNLLRLGGLTAALGGVLVMIFDLVLLVSALFFPGPGHFGGAANDALFGLSLLAQLSQALLALGLVGLYVRQSEAAGVLGLIGFLMAFPGLVLGLGIEDPPGWAAPLAYLGLALFAVSCLRAGVYPHTFAMLLLISAVIAGAFSPLLVVLLIGPGSSLMYVGVGAVLVFEASIAWLGYVLWIERDEMVQQPGAAG